VFVFIKEKKNTINNVFIKILLNIIKTTIKIRFISKKKKKNKKKKKKKKKRDKSKEDIKY